MDFRFFVARLLAAAIILPLICAASNAQDNFSCAQASREAAIPPCTLAIESHRYDHSCTYHARFNDNEKAPAKR